MAKLKFEMTKKQLESAVKGVQGIGHPVRLMILYALSKQELSVGELSSFTNVSQSVTSQHLSKMKDNGILENRKESNKVFYYIKDSKFVDLVQNIVKMYTESMKSQKKAKAR
ncbi:MAG: metalloregulator ArsR/SmtB family transcription factor [Spirochaetota bacterium]